MCWNVERSCFDSLDLCSQDEIAKLGAAREATSAKKRGLVNEVERLNRKLAAAASERDGAQSALKVALNPLPLARVIDFYFAIWSSNGVPVVNIKIVSIF
jgi:hypothetical protein